ncbi:MAG: hypothetical protein N3A58_01810 [Spirochaetes bacterium]|nr:hypothetical protein [Spirochaetota bacterium]
MERYFIILVCFLYIIYAIIRIKVEQLSKKKKVLDDYLIRFGEVVRLDKIILKVLTVLEIIILFLLLLKIKFIIYFNFFTFIIFRIIGVLLSLFGLFLICISSVILNGEYSSVIEVKKEHRVVKKGPYNIRHPIYIGFIFFHFGISIILSNYIVYFV